MSLDSLLTRVAALPDLPQRRVAALLGACVGDAAARPLHWVYDVDKLRQTLADGGAEAAPEFLPASASPFYALETGESSCYFDMALSALRSLRGKGAFDYDAYVSGLRDDLLGPGSGYDADAKDAWLKLWSEKRAAGETAAPLEGRWLQAAPRHLLENAAAGKERPHGDPGVKQSDGFCVALPYVLKLAGGDDRGELDMAVKELVESMSTDPAAVQMNTAAARLVERALVHPEDDDLVRFVTQEVKEELPEAAEALEAALAKLEEGSEDHVSVVGGFGRSCAQPGSTQGAVHAAAGAGFDLLKAVRTTLPAGGCNVSRSLLIGALCGAREGRERVPTEVTVRTALVVFVFVDRARLGVSGANFCHLFII